MDKRITEILRSVSKPYRYAGGEMGERKKAWKDADVKICLVFPEVYELGMSHLGLSILYHIVNGNPEMLAERAFTPWLDMEAELKSRNEKLFSLETKTPLDEFDILGFSLGYELTYSNILTVLKLSKIPIYSKDRDDSHPIIIAGGPCTYNPKPVSPFFDVMAIGDGESLVVEVARIIKTSKKEGECRADLLKRLSKVGGLYVPSLGSYSGGVGRAVVPDLNEVASPEHPVVPYATTQMRMAVEASRGCTRGCRFCQAGYIYRPIRQREGEVASRVASEGIKSTGHEEFSFLSLSVSDWDPLEYALRNVHSSCDGMLLNASLPSMRVEAMTDGITKSLGRARSGSFTLAPEAGSERMRRFINKGNTDGDLYASAERIFKSGWQAIKLYFMVGLPGETEEDLEGITQIARRCLQIGRKYHRRPDVTVSTSTFVPKSHTPFQWEGQITIDETRDKQGYLKRKLKGPGLHYKWHDPDISYLEGIFSRGGEELARVIELAHEDGARFDGWDECFDLARWKKAFANAKIDSDSYLEARGFGFEFPWDDLKIGPSKDFLKKELEKAKVLKSTPDCSRETCSNCGLCDFDEVKNRLADRIVSLPNEGEDIQDAGRRTQDAFKYRIQYSKNDAAAFLGGVEVTDMMRLAFRSAGLPFRYSQGFHPRVKLSVGPALPMGMESEAEFVDVELATELSSKEMQKKLDHKFSEGISIIGVRRLEAGEHSIGDAIASISYEATLAGLNLNIDEGVAKFEGVASFPYTRMRGKSTKEVDLKDIVVKLAVLRGGVLEVTLLNQPPSVKVSELLKAIFEITDEVARKVPVKKTKVEWRQ